MGFGIFGNTFGAFDRLSAASAPASTLWDDLLEYVPLSEDSDGSGPIVREGSYIATKWTDAANTPSTTGHVHAKAANFTQASSQYLYRTDYRLSPSGSFTLAAWVRRIEDDEEGYRFILAAGKYNLFITHDHTLVSDCNATNYHNSDFDGIPMTRLTWHLARCWYDAAAGTWNNQLDDGPKGTWEIAAPEFSNAPLTIGGRGGDTPDKFWGGDIGPVMWWSKVLSDAEWAELYNGGDGVAYAGEAADPPWAPTAIADCELWLDAHDLDGTGDLNNGVADLAAVATWADKSGNSRDMAQADEGKQPTYRASQNVGSLTYRPSVEFTADVLTCASIIGGAAGTVIAALKVGSGPAAYQAVFASADEASSGQRMFLGPYYGESDINQLYVYHEGNGATDQVKGSTTVAASTAYIMVWQSSGSAYSFRVNGSAETPTVCSGGNSGDWLGDLTGADNIAVGACKYNSTFFYLSGLLAELLVFSRALTGTEIATIEAYLAAKWGLTLS